MSFLSEPILVIESTWVRISFMNINYEDLQEENQFEGLVKGLIDNKYGSCNDFILPSTVTGLKENIQNLSKKGSMKLAGIGNQVDSLKNNLIRGDKINWIESGSSNQFEILYLRKIKNFITYLNKTCFTSIKGFESHYSSYEKGTFYKRHIDQFKTEKGRKYSIILYLNQDWKEVDGGKLSLYPEGRNQKTITPLGGKLVFFKSDEMEHEVHPSLTRERNSIAGWFKN